METTRYERFTQNIAGTSVETVTVHAVLDLKTGRSQFSLTRTNVETMRTRVSSDDFRFIIGLEVPVDSKAALLAMEHWLSRTR